MRITLPSSACRTIYCILFVVIGITQQSFAQVNFTSSDLPIMVIETDGSQNIPNEPKIDAQMKLIHRDNWERNLLTDPGHEYDGRIGIEIRGSTSASLFPKVGYGFETRFADNSNNNISLLGLPAENDWVLHGPYSDKTLMRNALAYILAGEIMDYAPRVRHVEMIINGDYQGVYLLTEKIKRDKNRVNISKLRPEDTSGDQLTGGYIIKVDKYTGNSTGWSSGFTYPDDNDSHDYIYHEPKFDEMDDVQRAYIKDFIFEFEFLMSSDNFNDETNGYSKWIDEKTFVDGLLINEISKNIDAYRLSTFLYKDRDSIDSRLKFGPVWDFNLAFGNVDYCEGFDFTGWMYKFNDICPWDTYKIPFYWDKLLSDNFFKASIRSRWEALRADKFSNENLLFKIDSLAGHLEESQARNFEQWPVLNEYVWPNPSIYGSYDEEVESMKVWLLNRVAWMDVQVKQLVNTSSIKPSNYTLYPNPTSAAINFNKPVNQTGVLQIQILDVLGRKVIEQLVIAEQFSMSVTGIDVSVLPSGTFYYSILRGENILHTGVMQKL